MLKPILWFESATKLILTTLEHASCADIVHASYMLGSKDLGFMYLES